ncbi:MAG: ATP-binding cassette domain-containing protein [Bacteroidota bacterium]
MLKTQDLQFGYVKGPSFIFPDIHCEKGDHILILGKSGTGKTTLLHLLGGLLKAQQGAILVGDTDLTELSANKLDHFRGKHISIIFQKSHFVTALTVKDNLRLAQYLADEKQDIGRIQHILAELGLANKLGQKTHKLSIGEQQRVAIARAVLNQPDIILADEPTSSLDDENCEAVIQLLKDQASAVSANLVIVTHDQRLKDVFSNQIVL